MATTSQLKPTTVGFGIERLGLISLNHPKLTLFLLFLLYIALNACALNLKFESDTRALFHSETHEFTVFDKVSSRYAGLLNRVLLLVEGEPLKTAQGLENLRTLHLDLEFLDDVASVTSLFSARHPPISAKDKGRAFVPDPLDETQDMPALLAAINDHAMVKDKLFAKDGSAALVIVTLNEDIHDVTTTAPAIAAIRQTAGETLAGTGLTHRLTGQPIIRTQVIQSLVRDQFIFIIVGVMIGVMFAYMFFRDIKYVIIINLPVTIAMSGLLGGMWLTGQKVTILSGMATPLISVITLAAALHLSFAIRRALPDARDLKSAIKTALIETGPGCVLSSLTTALALLALTIAPFPFIKSFGIVTVIGALFALFATLLTLPAAAYLIFKAWPPKQHGNATNGAIARLIDRVCEFTADLATQHSLRLTLIAVSLVAVLGSTYLMNKPSFEPTENLPATSEAVLTVHDIDKTITGTNLARIFIEWNESRDFPNSQALDTVEQAQRILADKEWIKTVWSVSDLLAWAQSGGLSRDDALTVVRNVTDKLSGQVLTTSPPTALVTGYFDYIDARDLLPRLNAISAELDKLNREHPEITASLTGTSHLQTVISTQMINTLNWSLLSAIGLIIVLIAIALRSLRAGLVSIIPNLFPIAIGGSYLFLTDKGLQFTSVVAFTIGFGMAVDSTIHYLNHYNLAKAGGRSTRDAIRQTTRNLGPVLIVTTLIVSAGLGATLLSDLPLVNLYGQVSVLVLGAALVADLVFLPAIIATVDRDDNAETASSHDVNPENWTV